MKQYDYRYLWLYGITEPLSGESFFRQYPALNMNNFQDFIRKFSAEHKHCLNIIIADRSRCHTSENIEFYDNIVMIFIPPYSPELNPIERLWKYMKDKIAEYNELYGDLKILSSKISGIIAEISNHIVKNLTFSSYIKEYFING